MREGYKETVLGEIPEDWDIYDFENVFNFIKTKSLSRANLNYETGDCFYIHYGDIHSSFKFPILDLSKDILPRVNKNVVLGDNIEYLVEGDLVIADASEDLEGVGSCIELKNIEDRTIIGGLHTIVCRDSNQITANGIKPYLLKSPLVLKSLKRIATGASVLGVSKGNLKKIKLIIPPLPEQQKIATILSTVDEKIDLIDQQIAETQNLKKGLMQRLLTKGIGHTKFKDSPLGEIPESWEVVKLEKLINPSRPIRYGIVQTGKNLDSGIPCVRVVDFNNRKLNKDSMINTSKKISDLYPTTILVKGDIIFALRGRIGDVRLINEDAIGANLTRGIALISNSAKVISEYLLWQIRSRAVKRIIALQVNGTTLKEIPIGGLKKVTVPIATINEQKKIGNILSTVESKIEILSERKTTYQALKKGLMQQLLTGKLRVNTLSDQSIPI